MRVHIGKKIKDEVNRQNMSIISFARKINRSRNVAYNIFERESVDTDLLNKIGKVLNCDFFSLYSSQKEYSQEGIKNFYAREPEPTYFRHDEEIALLKDRNNKLEVEVAYLKKILALLEKGKSGKGKKK